MVVYLTWNIVIYQDINSDSHVYRTEYTMRRAYVQVITLLCLNCNGEIQLNMQI